jgi:preflagellin peptidase FlaK
MAVPEVAFWIDYARVLASLSFLSASSWYDYKFREVSNRMWLLYAPTGFALTLLQYLIEYMAGRPPLIFLEWLMSFTLTTGISLGLFYAGFFGGADAKALICLSISIPIYPAVSPARGAALIPFFPVAALVNAVLASSVLVLALLSYNLVMYLRIGREMFRGLEHEPLWKKILVFASGVQVNPEKIGGGSHYIPMEYLSKGDDGKVTRHLRVSPSIEEKLPEEFGEIGGKIWATPGLPFLIFVTIGFLVALLFGDLTSWLVNLFLTF